MSKTLNIFMPVKGKVTSLYDLNDYLFKDKLVGDGVAVIPETGLIVSPVDGEITVVTKTNHCISIDTEEGAKILIHFGLDTARLEGRGIGVYVKEGDKVKAGDKLLLFDFDYIHKNANITTPIVITNKDIIKNIEINYNAKNSDDVLIKAELK